MGKQHELPHLSLLRADTYKTGKCTHNPIYSYILVSEVD